MANPAARRALILGEIDPARMRGLEIGALDKPLVRKADGDIRYVDFADTQTIRSRTYDSTVDAQAIVDVDIVWATRPLAEAAGEPVDYIVASHVIEHVPDLIGWLQDLGGALKPDGRLALAVPDKRFSFDLLRNPSTISEAIEAFVLQYRRPSIRQVADQSAWVAFVDIAEAWRRDLTLDPPPKKLGDQALQVAYSQAGFLSREPVYLDTHCWVFTPQSLLRLLDMFAQLKLLPFRVEGFTTTPRDELEFYLQLRRTDPEQVDVIRESIRRFFADEPTSAQVQLAAMEASSSWKLTAPLRALRRVVSRGLAAR